MTKSTTSISFAKRLRPRQERFNWFGHDFSAFSAVWFRGSSGGNVQSIQSAVDANRSHVFCQLKAKPESARTQLEIACVFPVGSFYRAGIDSVFSVLNFRRAQRAGSNIKRPNQSEVSQLPSVLAYFLPRVIYPAITFPPAPGSPR